MKGRFSRIFSARRKVREIELIESSVSKEVTRVPYHNEVVLSFLFFAKVEFQMFYKIKDDVLMNDIFTMATEETYEFFKRIFPSVFDPADGVI